MELNSLHADSSNTDFRKLIELLDMDLNKRYGEQQKQYDKHNKVDSINDVIVIYKDGLPAACGAFKEFDAKTAELKRMFVVQENRRQGLARMIIGKLEELAKDRGYQYMVLETGKKQIEAINLYKYCGYNIISNYGPYIDNDNSICMKKELSNI